MHADIIECVLMIFTTTKNLIKFFKYSMKKSGIQLEQTPVRRHVHSIECPTTQEHWDRLVNKSLSGSDFDLMIHNNSDPSTNPTDFEQGNSDLKSPTSV